MMIADVRGAAPERAPVSHVPPLDGIRGLSALVVVVVHASHLGLLPPVPGAMSIYAVMVFFALSGFLMGYLYLDRPFEPTAGSDYVAARIARIVPLYYGIVLFSWVIYNFIDPTFFYAMTSSDLVRHLLFVGSVSYFWSIGPEVQFYAVFLLLWWAIARSREGEWRSLIILLGVSALIFVFQPVFPGITVFSKLHIFLAGAGLAIVHRLLAPRLQYSLLALAVQIAVLGMCLLAALSPAAHQRFFAVEPNDPLFGAFYGDARRVMIAALIVFAFSFETRLANLLFANRLARQVGAYSYSIYLLHGPVLWAIERSGLFLVTGPAFGFAVVLVAVYLVGWLSFNYIERPSQKLIRKPLAAWIGMMMRPFASRSASGPLPR